jgi:hypothetical protein
MVDEWQCPRCAAATDWAFDCPGYRGRSGGTMVCQGCGNTVVYTCGAECGWWYSHDWNRTESTPMGERPPWIDNAQRELMHFGD